MKTSMQFNNRASLVLLSTLLVLLQSQVQAVEMAGQENLYIHWNKNGELIRPVGYREWIYIGTPLTPNDMNNGKAAFPEFHNVYIDPQSWKYWKANGTFPDQTLVVKELVSVGTKQASSGNGYFQGKYLGLEASLKSKQHFPDSPGNWGFFRFTIENSDQLRPTAMAQPEKNCVSCHQVNAATDLVFSQYYPVLRASLKQLEKPGQMTKQ